MFLPPFKIIIKPGWCGLVGWALACGPIGCQFDSPSGHMPGLQARSPFGGMQEAADWCFSRTSMFLSLSFSSLSLSLKYNENKSLKIKELNSFPFPQSKPASLLKVPISVSVPFYFWFSRLETWPCPRHHLLPPPMHMSFNKQLWTVQCAKRCAGDSPCLWVHPKHHMSVSGHPHLSPRSPQQSPSWFLGWSCTVLIPSPLCNKSALALKSENL